MNIPKYSLDNSKVIWFFLAVMLIGGVIAFNELPKKEDSPFVIKTAAIITRYPGATPDEVERLITEPIEREIQTMRNVYKISSDSYYGSSKIMIELDPATNSEDMPQMWDELRRKVLNVQPQLPQGASSISVSDDFGDVFGIYYGLTADEGFSSDELRDWAQLVKKELVTIPGVQKITLYGEQVPVVNLSITLSELSKLAISLDEIVAILRVQNTLINSGEKVAGSMQIKIVESGTYGSIDDIADQVLTMKSGRQIRLGDIVTVEEGYLEPPATLMRVNGERGIGIGVSTNQGENVVEVGDRVTEALDKIYAQMPIGIELVALYPENVIAREANNIFIVNLMESILIVILVIMLVMGLRAGILIGSSLLFSIGGTLLIMMFVGEGLNRTSLAGFIIAMGMLVDNAIVVADNAMVSMQRGVKRREALINGAVAPQWGLLGATVIAICSFLPLYLAPSSVAEIVKPLFVVLAISLILSWVLALSQTPLFGSFMLKEVSPDSVKEPYTSKFYKSFDSLLSTLLRHRVLTLMGVVGLFVLSLVIMGTMPQNFFPNLDKPYFRADCFMPEGYNIRYMERNMKSVEEWLVEQPAVKNVSITMGSSPPRYYLASSSFGPKPNFANILVELTTKDSTNVLESRFNEYVSSNYPDILLRSSLFKLSPAVEASIEMGFIGDNVDTLIALTSRVEAIMKDIPGSDKVRNSWGNRVPTWAPNYSQVKGARVGINRESVAKELNLATNGYNVGVFRRKDQFMPILMRDENMKGYDLSNMRTVPIMTPKGVVQPLEQVVTSFDYSYEFNQIKRYNRQKVMMAQCDPQRGVNTKELFTQIYDRVQSDVVIPEGYVFKIFGEEESQEQSNSALAANMPLTFILIFITLLLLFKDYKKPAVILLMVPMVFIGVVLGLLVMGKMFDFFAMLGLLGLVGMNIKNAIVLVDQIDVEAAEGKEPYEALMSATRSRIIPVVMASGTTILGMLPLLFDSMFGGMAATIMGGLFVATLLTILVLPITYALFFKIKVPKN